jgi:hypothetical protein
MPPPTGRPADRPPDGDAAAGEAATAASPDTASSAVPRIEAAARALALELDQAAYQVARANEPGKYVGLGVLLSILEKVGLDPAWERFLRTFLTGPLGMNVRNDVAHGFVMPDRQQAQNCSRSGSRCTMERQAGAVHKSRTVSTLASVALVPAQPINHAERRDAAYRRALLRRSTSGHDH